MLESETKIFRVFDIFLWRGGSNVVAVNVLSFQGVPSYTAKLSLYQTSRDQL